MSESASMTGSQSSYASGTSTVNTGARDASEERDEGDVAPDLEQKRTVEALMFIIVFNTSLAWNIDTNIWIWKAVSWTVVRTVVFPMGYDSYIQLFYVLSASALVTIATTIYIAMIFSKEESNTNIWLRRLVAVMQWVSYFIFCIFWACFLDFIVFMLNCHWDDISSSQGPMHAAFADQSCLAMPHVAHMMVAALMAVVVIFWTLCMSMSDCDLNPLTRNHMASPAARVLLTTMSLKIGLVLVASLMSAMGGKTQSILMCIIVAGILYCTLTMTPYYYNLVTYTWVGVWMGIFYTVAILIHLNYRLTDFSSAEALAYRSQMTWAVLYGIFPLVLFGALLSYCYIRYRQKPIAKFVAAAGTAGNAVVLRDVHRFKGVAEAEFLLRVMRKWDEDGVPDPTTTALGEFIMRCAMARLPSQPTLQCLYSNFMIGVRSDSQAARSQLQLAAKNNPTIAERYLIYVSQRTAIKLKSADQGLDLIGYVEYQRSYRACVRAHQLALQAQRQFWQSLLQNSISFSELQHCFDHMYRTEQKAAGLYKSAMERYPANGKLLKIYGRFLEFVKNDPWSAGKLYAESNKLGTEESLLNLAVSSSDGDIQTKLTVLLGSINEQFDAIVIINATGVILMANGATNRMFGYEKGELDGKNVSMLMPQPYSARHSSYLQRYVTTGQPKSLGTLMQLVALHKDHNVFPISLVVQQLSGDGADNIYMGVIRPTKTEDISVVKVWTTPTGIVLCVDEHFSDWFGITSKQVVGANVGTMTTDGDVLNRFLEQCAEMTAEEMASNPPRTRAKLFHKYLAAVEAEVSVEIGGSDNQRIYMLQLKCIADTLAVMVTDTTGRIQFATSQMAAMIGYTAKALTTGVNLNALLPPPYAQLHSSFMKDLSQQPPPTSCRAGSVVQLMHANGSKVAVTLQITQHDDGEHTQHVIKVYPASSTQLLDSQRLELQLNHKGTVLSINDNASKAVFDFDPQELIGRPLVTFVNLFSQWRQKFQEDESLLVMLAMRAEQGLDVIYRAGVHNPFSDEEMARGLAYSSGPIGAKAMLLGSVQSRHKEQPAIINLKMSAVAQDAIMALHAHSSTVDPEVTPVLTLTLFRAEGLTSVVEVDGNLNIVRAEPTLGLIFGVPHATLIRKSFTSLVNLPPSTVAEDLVFSGGQKGMLKQGAAWRIGPVKQLEARHLDEGLLKMSMQAVTKDGKSTNRLLILLKVLNSSTGSLGPLMTLKDSTNDSNADLRGNLKLMEDRNGSGSERDDSSNNDDDSDGDGGATRRRSGSPDLHDQLESRLRVQQWVAGDSQKKHQALGKASASGSQKGGVRHDLGSSDDDNDDHQVVVQVHAGSKGAIKQGATKGTAAQDGDSEHAGSEAAGSVISGDASAVTDTVDGVSATTEGDNDLLVDWRRAKRLKKLRHLMASSGANRAGEKYRKHTYMLLLLMAAAHITLFAVLYREINDNYDTMWEVKGVAEAIEHSQMIATLSTMIQKCGHPDLAKMFVCQTKHMQQYTRTMQNNYNVFKYNHQHLYLGYDRLKQLDDARLMEYWTHTKLPETTWFADTLDKKAVTVPGNNTIWNIGNRYMQYSQDVRYNAQRLMHKLNGTNYWNYIYYNGPESIFQGYGWSLDVYMDYAWGELRDLNALVLLLLLLEVLLFQGVAIIYGLSQLLAANRETMKRFSVFLALPSATVRGMASKQLQVDDDEHNDIDDDEKDAINSATVAAATNSEGDNSGNASTNHETKTKSVRMRVEEGDEESGTMKSSKKGKHIKKKSMTDNSMRSSTQTYKTTAANGSQAPATLWHKMGKVLSALANSTFKVNGKKLLPSYVILWKQAGCLFLWMLAVIIIYSVTMTMLRDIRGPLASMSAAARVRSRIARVRFRAVAYGFVELEDPLLEYLKSLMKDEVAILRHEYNILLYGGKIDPMAENLNYDVANPAAGYLSKSFSNIFFTTKECLRSDKSGCFPEGSEYYQVTHQGLDAMVVRFMQEMTLFTNLPNEVAFPDHPSYQYVTNVAANDMYEGFQKASHLFVTYTISRFEQILTMHIILLVVSLLLIFVFFWKLFWPYILRLKTDSKMMAGILSQLPTEVDIESHIKTYVLGIQREGNNNMSMRMGADMTAGQAGMYPPGGNLAPMLPPGRFEAGMQQQPGQYGNVPGMYNSGQAGYQNMGGYGGEGGGFNTGAYYGGGGGGGYYNEGPPAGRHQR